jgi:hypothetical protein
VDDEDEDEDDLPPRLVGNDIVLIPPTEYPWSSAGPFAHEAPRMRAEIKAVNFIQLNKRYI